MMDLNGILKNLPHVFPFWMIDRILEIEKGRKAIALKNVSIGEPYFLGHFQNDPVMPGVLILEAMAQTEKFFEGNGLFRVKGDCRVPPLQIGEGVLPTSPFWFATAIIFIPFYSFELK